MNDAENKKPETKAAPETSELDKAKAERDEYLAGWQRAKADFVNAKRRMEEEMKSFRQLANEGLIEELLPVLKSFEMAFANKEAWEKADKNWRSGVEYIYSQIKSVLEQNGLQEIDPMGQRFDPNRDEATELTPVSAEADDNKIVAVVSKGYSLNGKLIVPPKVKVGHIENRK
jgi:molecular chaperone GrpE